MDGVLVIDKPEGWTSHDVVAKVRNITRIKKVGHTGTLDPFATGVLPLTLGRATRLTNFFLSSDKLYRGVMRFGFATTTFDREGEAVGEVTSPELDVERLRPIFASYVGSVTQTIPAYSAKKLQGKPLYEYARKGISVEPATKQVQIRSLRLIAARGAEVEFELSCAAGTYARSLAHDIGKVYGGGAHLLELRRLRSGEFPVEAAMSLRNGDEFHSREFMLGRVIPLSQLLPDIPAIVVSAGEKQKVMHGMDLNVLTSSWSSSEYRILDESGEFVALASRVQGFGAPAAQPVQWVRVHPHVILGQ
jgi:tRNA pseudouridine55 synthase